MQRQHGFGLLEILIAMVVLGVAVVGLVAFSKSALVASQDGRRYEIAMRLAESKLDEFRNFNTAASAAVAYNDISSDSNGKTLIQSGDSYKVTWCVTDQNWNAVMSVWQDAVARCRTGPTSGQKNVTVFVDWNDSGNNSKQLQLSSNISPSSSLLKNQLNGGLDSSRSGPEMTFTPGDVPDVISSNLGNDSKQETSKPTPTVKANKNSINKEVQFETVTYKPTGLVNTKQIQQDITSVSCSCSYGSTLDSYLPGQAYSTSTNQFYWTLGAQQSKQTGVADESGLCTSCCRDHFDGSESSFTSYYAPLNTRRQRYDRSLALSSSGSYIDACRFVRLDGYYRPLPDWNLVKVIVTTSDFFDLDKTANQVSYQNYIKYVVKTYIDWQKQTLKWAPNQTVAAPTISEFDDWLHVPGNAASGGDTTTGVALSPDTYQLIARGIYVDILNPSYLAGIDTNAIDYMAKVPFYDINLTMLAEWLMVPLSGGGDVDNYAQVANDPVATIPDSTVSYYGKYDKGKLLVKKLDDNLDVNVKAVVYLGNSGVTATAVSPLDKNNALSSKLTISAKNLGGEGGGTTPPTVVTVSGKIECMEKTGNGNSNPAPMPCDNSNIFTKQTSLTVSPSSACSINIPQLQAQVITYSCTMAQDNTATERVVFSYSGSKTFNFNPTQLDIPRKESSLKGPCVMMVESGVTNGSSLQCSTP